MSGMDEFAPYLKKYGCFIVKNIAPDKKVIRIFHYPIYFDKTRDILAIPGVAESDIRASLLKGELRHKILAKEIIVTCSDIDLLQFNLDQKLFLQSAGIVNGLEVSGGSSTLNYAFRDEIPLIGLKDGFNRSFYTPEKFINGSYFGNTFHIEVSHNGKKIFDGIDYTLSESGGLGTGYDTINFVSFVPVARSVLKANYVISV